MLDKIVANRPDELSDVCYELEADLSVPAELHDRLSDLSPPPNQQKPPSCKTSKLLLTLQPKRNYMIHAALLKIFIEQMAVIVEQVQRAIGLGQHHVFKAYIDKNTTMRA